MTLGQKELARCQHKANSARSQGMHVQAPQHMQCRQPSVSKPQPSGTHRWCGSMPAALGCVMSVSNEPVEKLQMAVKMGTQHSTKRSVRKKKQPRPVARHAQHSRQQKPVLVAPGAAQLLPKPQH